MQINTLKDLLIEQVKDMYSYEQQVANAYGTWHQNATSGDLKRTLQHRIDRAQQRQNSLKEIASDLDAEATGHKCKGTEGILKEGHEFLDEAGEGRIRDAGIIANVQRTQHYGVAGYGCAQTYARALGLDNHHNTLEDFADEDGDFDERLTQLAEDHLNEEAMAAA